MAVIVLSSPRIYCRNVDYNFLFDSKHYISQQNGFVGERKFGSSKVLQCGYMVNWKKHWRKNMGLRGFVMKSSYGVMPNGGMTSEETIAVLKSISDPNEAFLFFRSVAELPNIVHTTEICNYMLELLRVHRRVGDMAVMFDLMQKQIIYRNLNTYLNIFKSLHVRGGIRQAPLALERMRKAGFFMNAYSYNGLIYLLLHSGYCKEL